MLVVSAPSAYAESAETPRSESTEESATLVRAAEAAFAAGDYGFAIQAWLRAFARNGHAASLLDVARAHHRRYERDGDPRDRADAMATYRRYLRAAPRAAPDRREVERRLTELEAIVTDRDNEPTEPRRVVTRLGVLSDTLGSEVSVDDGPFRPVPSLLVVSAGVHRVVVRAPDHETVERSVRVSRGSVVALDIRLEPEPAELVVTGAEDATVHIDGQRVQLPEEDDAPLRIGPGEHLVAVTQTGFHPYARQIDLRRGGRETIDVDLEPTGQRAAAIALLTVGGLGLTAGIVLGALAVDADRSGRASATDDFRTASGIVGISGVLVLVTGGTLLILDEPTVPTGPTLSLSPRIGPQHAGVGVTASF